VFLKRLFHGRARYSKAGARNKCSNKLSKVKASGSYKTSPEKIQKNALMDSSGEAGCPIL